MNDCGQFNNYSMNIYVLLDLEHTNDVTIVVKLLSRVAHSSVKFDNDRDVIFMFKIQYNISIHGISVLL